MAAQDVTIRPQNDRSARRRRTLIEHVWRIRLSRVSQSKAIYKIVQVSPKAAQDYAEYQANEMVHDKLFTYTLEHESPIAPVISNYLVEYT